MFHPRRRWLHRFADGTLQQPPRERVAAHLAGCPKCRDRVVAIRALAAAARTIPPPPMPDLLPAIVTARASGGRGIIPVADPPPRARRSLAAGLATAAIAFLAAVALGLLVPLRAADPGGLSFEPAHPTPGSAIHVVYRSAQAFRGQERLVLRVRSRRAPELREEPPAAVAAILQRTAPGRWEGSLAVDDSVVYGAFVVEDLSGRFMDSNARQPWELLAYDGEGAPLLAALEQRRVDQAERDWNGAYSTARAAAQLYPPSPAGWLGLRSLQLATAADQRELDSLSRWYRERFQQLESERRSDPSMSGDELAWMFWFAGSVKDSSSYAFWRDRLIREAPTHYRTVQLTALAFLTDHRNEPDTVLREFDRLWDTGLPFHWQLRWHALRAAVALGRLDDVRKWGERLAHVAPRRMARLAIEAVDDPATRPAAMYLLRMRLTALETTGRELMRTVPEQDAADRLVRARLLAALGRALAAEGKVRAAAETLEASNAWDSETFALVARGYLALKDTANAVPMLARLAAEPGLPLDSAWALRRSAERLGVAGWGHRVDLARREMIERTMAGAVLEALPHLPMEQPGAPTTTLAAQSGAGAMVVALWSRHDQEAHLRLRMLATLSERLGGAARLIVITRDGPLDQLRQSLAGADTRLPVFLVPRPDFVRAWTPFGTPEYLVIDAKARVRFAGTRLEELPRLVEALRAEAPSLAGPGWQP